MYILGISAYYHDSAAALLKDGSVVAAIQEERITRVKHDNSFPINAIHKILEMEKIGIEEIGYIVYYEKPFWKFERILDTITNHVPFSFKHFAKAIPLWVKNRLWIGIEIRKKLKFKGKILYSSHHHSHAAAAFYTSPFEDATIISLDGVGEYVTTSIGIGKGNQIEMVAEQHFPHSLGLLYSAFTQYCGFKVNSGEYKLMGLAPYGNPIYKQKIYDHFIKTFSDGSNQLDMKYFSYAEGFKMVNKAFEKVFGWPCRKPETEMNDFYKDVAASIQVVLEELVLVLVKQARELTKKNKVVFGGGVALNCKLNQKIVEAEIFREHYFYPNPGDAGSALGAAYLGWYEYLKNKRQVATDSLDIFLGNKYDFGVEEFLKEKTIPYHLTKNTPELIAKEIANGKIVGWFNGRMEFGPRALGNRSILADPRRMDMKDLLNKKIKLRESFRPFAPAVLKEKATFLFELHPTIYDTMMVTAKAQPGTAELMPAAIHADGTARIQTVSATSNPQLYKLIKSFDELTGCPALINTSLNVRGEPIVESPTDAIRAFLYTDMDILVFEGEYMLTKDDDFETVKKHIQPIDYAAD